jgi:RNA polymerase sigma factor (sigma-70 family)
MPEQANFNLSEVKSNNKRGLKEKLKEKAENTDNFIQKDFDERFKKVVEETETYNSKDEYFEESCKANNNSDIKLEQAVKDYRNGCEEAFNYIFKYYKPKLERLAYRKNDDELSQELLIVLHKAVNTYDNSMRAKFNTYFWKCAQNHMGVLKIKRNAKKRTAKYGEVSMNKKFDTGDGKIGYERFISDDTIKLDYKKATFYSILEEKIYPYLKESEKETINLYLEGLTLEEIGEELGITAPAVHVKLRRMADKKRIGKFLKSLFEVYCR